MAPIQVSVINHSTVLTDAEVAAAVADLQTQVHRDFAPAWGVDADLTFVPSGTQPDVNTWWLVIMDFSDQQGALGYHDLTPGGMPIGKVFAASDKQAGYNWTITASHELLEMLADPEIDLVVFVQQTARGGVLYSYEICDACEDDKFGYKIGNTMVSDFVYKSWFQSQGTGKFDQMDYLKAPFQLIQGGYIGIYDVRQGGQWHQITADSVPNFKTRAHLGSRRERRRLPKDQWSRSTAWMGGVQT